jgi:hypothetical protein
VKKKKNIPSTMKLAIASVGEDSSPTKEPACDACSILEKYNCQVTSLTLKSFHLMTEDKEEPQDPIKAMSRIQLSSFREILHCKGIKRFHK